MRGPGVLGIQYHFRHRKKQLLLMRGDEDFCGDIRAFVERNEAYHELHFSLVAVDDALDEGIEGSAGFAGWIKKLDDGDGCCLWAKYRRVHANQAGLFCLHLDFLGVLHPLLVSVHAEVEEQGNDGHQTDDSEFFGVHERVFRR